MKTPILSELYFTWRDAHPEQFTDVIKSNQLQSKENAIEDYLSSILDEAQIDQLMELIWQLESDCCHMGYIDGFKMGCSILAELSMSKMDNIDFMNEILLQE